MNQIKIYVQVIIFVSYIWDEFLDVFFDFWDVGSVDFVDDFALEYEEDFGLGGVAFEGRVF